MSELKQIPPRMADECPYCGAKAHFKARDTQPSSDPNFRLAYCRCPECGNTIVQRVEVVAHARHKRRAIIGGHAV